MVSILKRLCPVLQGLHLQFCQQGVRGILAGKDPPLGTCVCEAASQFVSLSVMVVGSGCCRVAGLLRAALNVVFEYWVTCTDVQM